MKLSTLDFFMMSCCGILTGMLLLSTPTVKESLTVEARPTCKQFLQAEPSDRLWRAIVQVESGGNPNAVADAGKAVGVGQIWPILVDDCNRIVGTPTFTYQDRYDPIKSYEMFVVWRNHYCRNASDEVTARRWNQGVGGPLKECTKKYAGKVLAAMSKEN